MPLKVGALDHLVINVESVTVSAEWYQRVLGMEREDFQPAPGKTARRGLCCPSTAETRTGISSRFRRTSSGRPFGLTKRHQRCFACASTQARPLCVSLYFWSLLFGAVGTVISKSPAESAGTKYASRK